MSNIYDIQIDPLNPALPLVNNLSSHFGQEMSEVLDLRVISLGHAAASIVENVEAEPRRIGRAIGTAFKFATTTGFIFTALFVAFNWGAYSQKFEYWYRSVTPGTPKTQEQQLLASVLETNQPQITQNAAQAFADEVRSQQDNETVDFRALDVGPSKDYLVIPKLGKTIPLVYPDNSFLVKEDWGGLEKQLQASLQSGVAHYPGTAESGEQGNVVLTGHSSYYFWDPGQYKDVFANLMEMKVGDEVAVWHNGTRYVYKAFDVQTVKPTDTQILKQMGNEYDSTLTIITCTPVGTALNRFVVRLNQIFPDPQYNRKMEGDVLIGGELHA